MAETAINWEEIVTLFREGAESAASALEGSSEQSKEFADSFRKSLSFLDQIKEWTEKLPPERIHSSILSFIKKIESDFRDAVRDQKIDPELYGSSQEDPTPQFIEEVIATIGPEIDISTDKMKVHLAIDNDFSHIWNAEKIKNVLENHGIQGEIIEEGIQNVLEEPGNSFKVAVGRKPVSGKDAILEDCIGLDLDGIPMAIDKNKVDLKELNWVHNVREEQVLLKKQPATPGVPGMDVFGDEIPCKDGEDIPFPSIPCTMISEDGLNMMSCVDGCAYKERDSLMVVPSLEIKNNIDYSTGNVNASVTVNVSGDVLSGFKVESKNDIHVKGTVEGSQLRAKGSLFLPGGVQGKSEAVLVSEKHIEAKFINAAHVLAKGEVVSHGPIIQSKIRAWRIEAMDKEAEIIGGVLEAEEDVCADTIGSDLGVKTIIQLGYDIQELTDKVAKIKQQLQDLSSKETQCHEKLDSLDQIKEKEGLLNANQEKVKAKVQKNLEKIDELRETKQKQLDLTEEKLQKALEMKRMVRARKNMLPGVEITILEHSFVPQEPTGPITIFATSEGIEQVDFKERSFDSEEEESDE